MLNPLDHLGLIAIGLHEVDYLRQKGLAELRARINAE